MSLVLWARKQLQTALTPERRKTLRKQQSLNFRRLQHVLFRVFFGSNLKALSLLYGTDKWGEHWYAQYYQTHFSPLRHKKLNILEIGIGGYSDSEAGGGSLRVWRTYFPKSQIYGIDIYDKSCHDERRIKTFQGSQVDDVFLANVISRIGELDIVIDDGSHVNEHALHAFKYLFPRMSEGGLYVIEDTQTSYWPEYGGSTLEKNSPGTTMGFFKQLVDGLNHSEYMIDHYEPSYYDENITGLHFYHNMIFIQKGLNNEASNFLKYIW